MKCKICKLNETDNTSGICWKCREFSKDEPFIKITIDIGYVIRLWKKIIFSTKNFISKLKIWRKNDSAIFIYRKVEKSEK